MQLSQDPLRNRPPTNREPINSWFPDENHPCRILERSINDVAKSDDLVLEIGCKYSDPPIPELKGLVGSVSSIDVADIADVTNASINIAFSRCVIQHVSDTDRYYSELFRALRPGGVYLFLTPNFWGYESMMSRIIPSRTDQPIKDHAVNHLRKNILPISYRSNTRRSIKRLAKHHGFDVERLDYLSQSPSNFEGCQSLFVLGSKYEKFLARHRMLHSLRGWIFCTLTKKFLRDLH